MTEQSPSDIFHASSTVNGKAILSLFSAILCFASPSLAADPAETAFDACANSESIASPAISQIEDLGWKRSSSATAKDRDVLAEGILASMSTDRDREIDWLASQKQALDLAGSILSGVSWETTKLFTTDNDLFAVFVVYERNDNPDWKQLHCIYAGPTGAAMRDYLDTIRRMDATAGLAQATEGLNLFTSRSQSTTDTTPSKVYAVDAQYGVFTSSQIPVLNRPPKTEYGMSVYRFTQR